MHKPPPGIVALIVGLAIYQIGIEALSATLRAHGHLASSAFILLSTLGWCGWLSWWYVEDSRRRGKTPGLDLGYFWWLAWPLVMIGRLFVPGRRQTVLVILMLVGTFLAAKLAGLAVYTLLTFLV
jgi:hypothetical protein